MWKSAGSGWLFRSTLNRVTTVWKPCASMTVHCFNAKVEASKTSARCAVPPSAALSSTSIVTVIALLGDAQHSRVARQVNMV